MEVKEAEKHEEATEKEEIISDKLKDNEDSTNEIIEQTNKDIEEIKEEEVEPAQESKEQEIKVDEIIDNDICVKKNTKCFRELKDKCVSFFKASKKRSAVLLLALLIFIVIMVKACFMCIDYIEEIHETIDTENFYDGIYVNNIHLGGMPKDEVNLRLKELEVNLKPDIKITVNCCENSYVLDENMLNFDFDTEEVMEDAYNIGRDGSDLKRYKLVKSLDKNPRYFTISCTLSDNSENIENFVNDIASKVNIEEKADYVSKFNPNSANMFVFAKGCEGRKLNTDDLKTKLNETLSSATFTADITADVQTIEKPNTQGKPSLQEQTVLLSTFSTVSTNTAEANSNMNLALSSINGKVLQPGDVFSFNKCTGNTTNGEKGYLPATAIKDGQFVQEYGGGICQAATTVYGAALRADMKIVARTCHTYPSSYCPIGQDATIAYPNCDFKFKNSSEYPVFIKAYMNAKKLTVELYGYHPSSWDEIQVTSQGNENRTKATASKNFYKDGTMIKSEAIAASSYKVKQ